MKRSNIYYITLFVIITVGFASCKKERAPRLIIHVMEKDGRPAIGARVHAWPGNDPQSGNGSGIVNEEGMDQTLLTDGAGDATFEFPFSAVLDVDVQYFKQVADTSTPPVIVTDTLTGHRVVKIESVRQRDEKNDFNETVEVQ